MKKIGKEVKNHNLYFGVFDITPEQAMEILDGSDNFRKVIQSRVDRYSRQMIDGKWQLGEPLLFDENGKNFDGQHRLWGTVNSGKTQRFCCIFGFKREVAEPTVDDGAVRTASQTLSFSSDVASRRIVPIIRSIMAGESNHVDIANSEISELYQHYKQAVDFTLSCWPQNITGITRAPVMGAFAKCYICNPVFENRLSVAAAMIRESAFGAETETVPLRALYRYLTTTRIIPRDVCYRKAARMFLAYCREESLEKVIDPGHDLFPLRDGFAIIGKSASRQSRNRI